MKLINNKTKQEVKVGDEITNFRGEVCIVAGYTKKRVYCTKKDSNNFMWQWYPTVIDCSIVLEEGETL